MEIKTEVKVFLVEKQCEVCKKGTMNSTPKGTRWKTDPLEINHKFNNCDNTEYYTKQYPYQILEKQ